MKASSPSLFATSGRRNGLVSSLLWTMWWMMTCSRSFLSTVSAQQPECTAFQAVNLTAVGLTANTLSTVSQVHFTPTCPSADFQIPTKMHWHVRTTTPSSGAAINGGFYMAATDPNIVTPTVTGSDGNTRMEFAFNADWVPTTLGVSNVPIGNGAELIFLPTQNLQHVETSGSDAMIYISDPAGTLQSIVDTGTDNHFIVQTASTGTITYTQASTTFRSTLLLDASSAASVGVDIQGTETNVSITTSSGSVTGTMTGGDFNRLLVVGNVQQIATDGRFQEVLVNSDSDANGCDKVNTAAFDEDCVATNQTIIADIEDGLECQGPAGTQQCPYYSAATGMSSLFLVAVVGAVTVWMTALAFGM